MLGKPGNMEIDFSNFQGLLKIFMNNTGDPFSASTHKIDTKEFEREVLYFFF